MGILGDIPDSQLTELARVSAASRRSRAAIIRDAVAAYLAGLKRNDAGEVFGLWGDREIDGLEYQHKLRSEW